MVKNGYFDKVKSWANNENSDILSEVYWVDNANKSLDSEIPNKIKSSISEIIMGFDRSSYFSQHGDSYRFCKYFVELLHKSLNLYTLLNGNENNWEDPANVLKFIENEYERSFLMNIFPDIQSEDFNQNKDSFINWFIDLVEEIGDKFGNNVLPIELDVLDKFFKGIYKRDYLMNFREVSFLKNVFRSPLPSKFMIEPQILANYLERNSIKLIIDLRGIKEKNKNDSNNGIYSLMEKKSIKKVIVSFNEPRGPGNGYVRKLIHLKDVVLEIFSEILQTLSEGNSALFHCHSGKDRTGVTATLLQMLAGVDDKDVIAEYSATGHDTRPHRIIDVIYHIKSVGGIEKYLESCGFTIKSQNKLIGLIK